MRVAKEGKKRRGEVKDASERVERERERNSRDWGRRKEVKEDDHRGGILGTSVGMEVFDSSKIPGRNESRATGDEKQRKRDRNSLGTTRSISTPCFSPLNLPNHFPTPPISILSMTTLTRTFCPAQDLFANSRSCSGGARTVTWNWSVRGVSQEGTS